LADIEELALRLRQQAEPFSRYMVGIAGPPGSGKSTLSDQLFEALKGSGETAVVVPMDGFHFDDAILNARGHHFRKGAPHTFDVAGFEVLLKRIKAHEPDIAIPVFDRSMELARAGAGIISANTKFILVEGNYLLLKQPGWERLKPLLDFTISLQVSEVELERRLLARWRGMGFDETGAKAKALGNDIPNARLVLAESAVADLMIAS
jgi:pantothenate kinase